MGSAVPEGQAPNPSGITRNHQILSAIAMVARDWRGLLVVGSLLALAVLA